MYRHLPVDEKLKLIKRINAGEKIAKICKDVRISRTILYKWINLYLNNSPKDLKKLLKPHNPKGQYHYRKLSTKKENSVTKNALQHPYLSIRKIAEITHLSKDCVWKVLKRRGLHTSIERERHIRLHSNKLIWATPINDRITIMRRYNTGEKISYLCKEFHISRTIFYRWLKRYQKAEPQMKRNALIILRPHGEKHYRYVSGAKEFVLNVVIDHPDFSVRKISRELTRITGKHVLARQAVYTILKSLNLNTYNRRLAYTKSVTDIAAGQVSAPQVQRGWRIPIFGEIPSVSALAPPGFFKKFISSKFFFPNMLF